MRKVSIEVEAELTLKLPVKLNLTVRADEGANLDRIVKQAVEKGVYNHRLADVELCDFEEVTLPNDPDEMTLEEYLVEDFAAGHLHSALKVKDSKVTDSR